MALSSRDRDLPGVGLPAPKALLSSSLSPSTSASLPGSLPVEAQLAQRAGERYAGQLRAYGQMLIQARGLQRAKVKAGIYLTATRTWVEVPMEGRRS